MLCLMRLSHVRGVCLNQHFGQANRFCNLFYMWSVKEAAKSKVGIGEVVLELVSVKRSVAPGMNVDWMVFDQWTKKMVIFMF